MLSGVVGKGGAAFRHILGSRWCDILSQVSRSCLAPGVLLGTDLLLMAESLPDIFWPRPLHSFTALPQKIELVLGYGEKVGVLFLKTFL